MRKKNDIRLLFVWSWLFLSLNVFSQSVLPLYNEFESKIGIVPPDQLKPLLDQFRNGLRTTEDQVYYNMAKAQLADKGNKTGEAINSYFDAIQLAKQTGNKALEGKVYYRLGRFYGDRNNLSKSLESFNKALKVWPKDMSDTIYVMLYYHKALIYSYMGDNASQKKELLQIVKVANKLPSRSTESDIYNNMAICYMNGGQYDSAYYFFDKSLQLRLTQRINRSLGQSYNNLGTLSYLKENYTKALYFFEKGYEFRKLYTRKFSSLLESEINIGKTYYKLNDISNAKKYLDHAYRQADSAGHIELKRRALEVYMNMELGTGNYKDAFYHQRDYYVIMDSLYNTRKKSEILSMAVDYETSQRIRQDSIRHRQAEFEMELERKQQEAVNRRSIVIGILLLFILAGTGWFAYYLFRQNRLKQAQNEIITRQHRQLKEKQTEINDSINYASNIQKALLPSEEMFGKNCAGYFVFFQPKDVVSGDFYWATSVTGSDGELFIYVTADCTGHGVPGAFMSMISISFLNEIVNEEKVYEPDQVLNRLRHKLIYTLSPEGKDEKQDGLDCLVCVLNKRTLQLSYAGANDQFFVAHRTEEGYTLKSYSTDKMPVGKNPRENTPFTAYRLQLQKGDLIYTLSDGFVDQFGGPQNKKLKAKNVFARLEQLAGLPVDEQEKEIRNFFFGWKGDNEQIDDVTFICVKV